VILFGARTGADGIGGVSVLASETFDSTGPSRRPAVQVGDPFAEKVLIECCLELYAADVVAGIQDLGGAGLSCATSELASNGNAGMRVQLKHVLKRDESLTPEEILMSESQERMMAIVPKKDLKAFEAIVNKWEVEYSVLGEVIDEPRLYINWGDEEIVNVPPRTVAHDGPVYERPVEYPKWIDALNADSVNAAGLARTSVATDLAAQILQVVSSPNQASKSWITDQYDRYVGGNTALATPDDSGMVRVSETSGLGVAIATDANGRYCQLDPYAGAQLALAEAYRNVAASGAKPLAVTNCLNFGSPENPEVMWQFKQATAGLADACLSLGIPVTGGNVSFYNQTGDVAIHPTPVVGVLGVIDDVARRVPSGWQDAGHNIYLLGVTRDELDGSVWSEVIHDHLGGKPPVVDLAAEQALAELLHAASLEGLLASAHDLSEAGLAQAVVESSLRFNVGARIWLDEIVERDGVDLTAALFSESTGRVLVSVGREDDVKFAGLCEARGIPVLRIGVTDSTAELNIQDIALWQLADVREQWAATLPELFG
jgi:phosphoribosylformylglycinamidine synthase